MGWNTRGHPYGQIAASQTDEEVSAKPCGVVSVVLIGDGTNVATVKVEDGKTGTVVVALLTKQTAVYTPAKPDACSVGCYVTTGANSQATISIE